VAEGGAAGGLGYQPKITTSTAQFHTVSIEKSVLFLGLGANQTEQIKSKQTKSEQIRPIQTKSS
jgi:hypothetical protein